MPNREPPSPPASVGPRGGAGEESPPAGGDSSRESRSNPTFRPPDIGAEVATPTFTIAPATGPGGELRVRIDLGRMLNEALARAGLPAGADPDDFTFLISEEGALARRGSGGEGGEVPLPLTLFDLLLSSGLARSPGMVMLLLRHQAVRIDGRTVGLDPVPFRYGSRIESDEGRRARIVPPS